MTKLILDIPLGYKFKIFRKRLGYTQMDVVRKMNLHGSPISESTYAKIEQGTRNIYISDLILLKSVLNFTYKELFEDIEKSFR